MQNIEDISTLIALDSKAISFHSFRLTEEVYTIGRHSSCDIRIDDPSVSRLHAKIQHNGPRYVLYDTQSANGTFVNGRRVTEPHLLEDKDEIGFGSARPVLVFDDDDPTLPPLELALKLDRKTMIFYLDNQKLDLPPNEFKLLRLLYNHLGQICTYESCAEVIWGDNYNLGSDEYKAAIHRIVADLRHKFNAVDPNSKLVRNERGRGYWLNIYKLP